MTGVQTCALPIFSVNPTLYKGRLAYDPEKDLAPIVMAVTLPSVVMVHPSLPVNSIDELTAYARSSPTPVNYASSGACNPSHLGMELYKRVASVDMTHVPYKGGAPALQDLMSGQVSVMMAIGIRVPDRQPRLASPREVQTTAPSFSRRASRGPFVRTGRQLVR